MRRLLGFAAVLALFPVQELTGQTCLGSLAAGGQLGVAGLWARSGAVDAYGLDVTANLPGRVSAGLGYAHAGDTPSGHERSIHKLSGRVAYELAQGRLSLCPAMEASYDNGSLALDYVHPQTGESGTLHPAWRTIALPVTLNAGYRLDAPGGISVVPMASAGGMYWNFDGHGASAFFRDGIRDRGSQLAWFARLGATVGWNRVYLSGAASESTLPRSHRQWVFTVGWLAR